MDINNIQAILENYKNTLQDQEDSDDKQETTNQHIRDTSNPQQHSYQRSEKVIQKREMLQLQNTRTFHHTMPKETQLQNSTLQQDL